MKAYLYNLEMFHTKLPDKPGRIEPLACFIGMEFCASDAIVKIAYKLNELISAWNGREK